MKFGVLFNWFCVGTCTVSLLLNGILIIIAHKRRVGIGFYRFFTQATVLIGALYSLSFAIAQSFWYAGPGMLGFFSVAPWSNRELLIQISFQVWFTSFLLVLMGMTASFMYRFRLLCSSLVVSWFEMPRKLVITLCCQLSLCILWLHNTNYSLFSYSKEVRLNMQHKFSAEYQVNLMASFALTVNINDHASAIRSMVGAFTNTLLMQAQFLTMVYCGWMIHKTVKIQTMSQRLKEMHGKALKMMVAQVLNPVLFLYIPAFINLFGMFVDRGFGDLPRIIAMTLALFPIFNPIIIIYFTEEYKRYLVGHRTSIVQVSASGQR